MIHLHGEWTSRTHIFWGSTSQNMIFLTHLKVWKVVTVSVGHLVRDTERRKPPPNITVERAWSKSWFPVPSASTACRHSKIWSVNALPSPKNKALKMLGKKSNFSNSTTCEKSFQNKFGNLYKMPRVTLRRSLRHITRFCEKWFLQQNSKKSLICTTGPLKLSRVRTDITILPKHQNTATTQ